jgi:hypothetical protein
MLTITKERLLFEMKLRARLYSLILRGIIKVVLNLILLFFAKRPSFSGCTFLTLIPLLAQAYFPVLEGANDCNL